MLRCVSQVVDVIHPGFANVPKADLGEMMAKVGGFGILGRLTTTMCLTSRCDAPRMPKYGRAGWLLSRVVKVCSHLINCSAVCSSCTRVERHRAREVRRYEAVTCGDKRPVALVWAAPAKSAKHPSLERARSQANPYCWTSRRPTTRDVTTCPLFAVVTYRLSAELCCRYLRRCALYVATSLFVVGWSAPR